MEKLTKKEEWKREIIERLDDVLEEWKYRIVGGEDLNGLTHDEFEEFAYKIYECILGE